MPSGLSGANFNAIVSSVKTPYFVTENAVQTDCSGEWQYVVIRWLVDILDGVVQLTGAE